VVDKAAYPDWQSLDGETFTVHSRGSTSEALARIIEEEEGIEFGEISYVPGAEVRATALLRGNIKAAMLDIPTKNFVMSEAPGKFHALPTPETSASDEVLFGNTEWMEQNQESVQVLLEEVLKVWQSIVENPEFVQEERERLGLLPDLPAELEKELLPYYEQAAEEGLFTEDCGGEAAAKEDFEFYNQAGQLKADPADLQVEDFWTLEPSESALRAVEESGN
jgi:NitT/TauT family transport system substrate-binding protein